MSHLKQGVGKDYPISTRKQFISVFKSKEVFDFLYYKCGITSKKTGVQTSILCIYGRVEVCSSKQTANIPWEYCECGKAEFQ